MFGVGVVITDIALVSDRRHRPHVDSGGCLGGTWKLEGQQAKQSLPSASWEDKHLVSARNKLSGSRHVAPIRTGDVTPPSALLRKFG
jgi:hypothetical protein